VLRRESANDPKQTSLSTDRSINRCGDGSVGAAPLLYGVCFNIMISSMVQSDLASAGVSSIRPNRASRRG
jgi:hypothetical protein